MRPIINSPQLIGACGLYCGACRRYLSGKCPGCQLLERALPVVQQRRARRVIKCGIRQCCTAKGFHTCAECDRDVSTCKTHNSLIAKLFSILFNSDRAACIRYIRTNGEEAYAEKMAWYELMTMPRRR